MRNKTLIPPFFLAFILSCMFAFISCKKEKLQEIPDNRVTTVNRPLSNLRIINLGGYDQVIANGKGLTNFTVRGKDDPDEGKFPGTDYFPKDGRLGSSWMIPQDLFGTDGVLKLKFTLPGGGLHNPELNLKDDKVQPMDYYLLPNLEIEGQPEFVEVERSAAQPSKPDHFKVRVINLCANFKMPIFSPRGNLENLVGPVSLAYSDGTLVAPQTTNVTLNQRVSEYIELPYGTYQFRILTPNGRQFPGASPADPTHKNIDPPTSTMAAVRDGNIVSTNLTYAPIVTFQPGGVYTIVVAPYRFNYNVSPSEERGGAVQNSFKIISDLSPSPNTTYSRLQVVNAFSSKQAIGCRVDGQAFDKNLVFGKASDYTIAIQGTHLIEATDASGAVIASTQFELRPRQNYTAWLRPDATGKASLAIIPNDLSLILYDTTVATDDPSGILRPQDFFFNRRFLNMSPDYSYITFTEDNGKVIRNADNLQPGLPVTQQPYSNKTYWQTEYEMKVFRSSPGVVPGIWASEVPVLKSQGFIARPQLYENAGRPLPDQEPGVYTVALIGRSVNGGEPAEKARMIIVKHTK